MNIENKMASLVVKLHCKTIEGKLRWSESVKNETYNLAFTDSLVSISHKSVVGYFLKVYDGMATLVEEVPDTAFLGGESLYKILKEIYEGARRQAMNADKVIDDTLKDLDNEELYV